MKSMFITLFITTFISLVALLQSVNSTNYIVSITLLIISLFTAISIFLYLISQHKVWKILIFIGYILLLPIGLFGIFGLRNYEESKQKHNLDRNPIDKSDVSSGVANKYCPDSQDNKSLESTSITMGIYSKNIVRSVILLISAICIIIILSIALANSGPDNSIHLGIPLCFLITSLISQCLWKPIRIEGNNLYLRNIPIGKQIAITPNNTKSVKIDNNRVAFELDNYPKPISFRLKNLSPENLVIFKDFIKSHHAIIDG